MKPKRKVTPSNTPKMNRVSKLSCGMAANIVVVSIFVMSLLRLSFVFSMAAASRLFVAIAFS